MGFDRLIIVHERLEPRLELWIVVHGLNQCPNTCQQPTLLVVGLLSHLLARLVTARRDLGQAPELHQRVPTSVPILLQAQVHNVEQAVLAVVLV